MAVTDPSAIKFTNETCRPLCEWARNMKTEIDAHMVWWDSGGSAHFISNDTTPVEDGRQGEGIEQLTTADVNQEVNMLKAVAAAVNEQIAEKPSVRKLSTPRPPPTSV